MVTLFNRVIHQRLSQGKCSKDRILAGEISHISRYLA